MSVHENREIPQNETVYFVQHYRLKKENARMPVTAEKSGRLSPDGAFGRDGAAGAFVSFNPQNKISIVDMQSVCDTSHAVNYKDLINTVYSCLGF